MKLCYKLLMLSVIAVTTLKAPAQDLQHHVLDVGDFTHLMVGSDINVDYKSSADSAGLVVFDAMPEMVNCVMFSNNGKGKLTIKTDLTDVVGRQLPTLRIYSRHLFTIENRGDSTVRTFKVSCGSKFKVSLEGNGRLSVRDIDTDEVNAGIFTGRGQIALYGRCTKANLSCTGAGTIQADKLQATNVSATINGACSIGCNVSAELSVKGVGKGTLYYVGNPTIIKNRSLGGKIESLNE